ncbi:PHP domain-containing protein [bacterium]|nr:PHP domain-containing protein [bacterium]
MEVDLHLHSCLSDGTWTPAELVGRARAAGLAAIAVADHDTMAAVPDLLRAGPRAGVEVIAAVEITCQIDNREVHLLGYFPGADRRWESPALQAALAGARALRHQRVEQFAERFQELGIPLTVAEIEACAAGGALGRPHVAQALVKRGVVAHPEEAFARFLKRGRPGFVDRYRMPAAEAISQVRGAGGVPVLAHPALAGFDHRIPELMDQGLAGLEAWHCQHSPGQTEKYRALARQLGLLVTGGSDCHGPRRGETVLGTIHVPYSVVEALRAVGVDT